MDFTQEEILAAYKKYFLMRANLGKSDKKIAEEAGVCRETLSAWRTGKRMPSLPILLKLANFFNVKVTDFFAA